ncbi:MAG: DUF2796 domain-containing protein [Pseudomonadota bacterium]
MNRSRLIEWAVYATLFCSFAANGGSKPHVHGAAEITLAMEGHTLEIMLTSPAISVLGFENQARSDAQLQAVADAEKTLSNGADLFDFSGTQCTLLEADVDLSAVQAEQQSQDEHHDHHSSAHKEPASSHSDISAHYRFSCAEKLQLKTVRFGSNSLPFGLESVGVHWVTDSTQGAATLTPGAQVVELR